MLAPIKPEDEYKPSFKARPPKDLEYIVSLITNGKTKYTSGFATKIYKVSVLIDK